MIARIDAAHADNDTLGGTIEVLAYGLPPGLGSHVHWDRKLDARLAAACLSVQAMKGVEFGDGFDARRPRPARRPTTRSSTTADGCDRASPTAPAASRPACPPGSRCACGSR